MSCTIVWLLFLPYDGRNEEPVVFRAKIPVALIIGAEGIAVGMSTKILPYNIREVLEAEKKALRGESFEIYPDVPTGGLIDVSGYNDGNGKLITRAKFDMSDEKKIVITELPVDSTSESLMNSIESAYKSGKLKISSIDDFTTDHCQIEIRLPRGVYAKDVEKALYAFTDCEKSISCQMLVIKDNMPVAMTATEIIKYYAKKLTQIVKDELEFERAKLTEELHARTLERIFIEERIYKKIEQMKTAEDVNNAVKNGFKPFKKELVREITDDDVDSLLKIPIRRISLFDINKNRDQVTAINARLKEIAKRLKHLTDCAIEYLDAMLAKFKPEDLERRTQIAKFTSVDAKAIVKRDIPLRYDGAKGYLGTSVFGGQEMLKVTRFDRIFIMRKSGIYTVCDVPDRLFVDTGMWYCNYADKEIISSVLFTVIYRDMKTKQCYIKKCRIPSWIMNRDYMLAPEGTEVLHVDTREKFEFTLHYVKKPRIKIKEEVFNSADFEEKGHKAQGVRLSTQETDSVEIQKDGELDLDGQ
ncbi:MAG: DNA topoisomerase IV subunit A [Treponema sp.]|nr:DNA topoisomerase IV subunit A [Treponema sp.]